jgi:hypothetical protein
MRAWMFAGAALAFCLTALPAGAADLIMPHAKRQVATTQRVAPRQAACLRWVEQNYSWYNYCDPIPYYGKHQNHGTAWAFW